MMRITDTIDAGGELLADEQLGGLPAGEINVTLQSETSTETLDVLADLAEGNEARVVVGGVAGTGMPAASRRGHRRPARVAAR